MDHIDEANAHLCRGFAILHCIAHQSAVFGAYLLLHKQLTDHFGLAGVWRNSRVSGEDGLEEMENGFLLQDTQGDVPGFVGDNEKAPAMLPQRQQDPWRIGEAESSFPTLRVVVPAKGALEGIQGWFVGDVPGVGEDGPDRRSNEGAEAGTRSGQPLAGKGSAYRTLDSWQRIQKSPVQIEKDARGKRHLSSEASMLEASSSGERNGYMSSRFGV
jgi:hypothetical protein